MTKPELAQYYTEKQEDGRAYKHPFRKTLEGKPLIVPSVTTILKLENKDNLIQWAADKTLEWCVENWFMLGSRSSEDAFSGARYRWQAFRDERASVGTGIHDTIESEHTGGWNFPLLDEEQLQIMEQWRALNERHTIKPILSEFTVWDLENEFAGTADGLWEIDGKVCLVDIKTSKNTWPGHWMQLAALRHADLRLEKQADGTWKEFGWGLSIEDGVDGETTRIEAECLVHLRADKAEILWAEDLDLRWKQFKGYAEQWRLNAELKDRTKKRELAKFGGF